jgi:hypothetical protein
MDCFVGYVNEAMTVQGKHAIANRIEPARNEHIQIETRSINLYNTLKMVVARLLLNAYIWHSNFSFGIPITYGHGAGSSGKGNPSNGELIRRAFPCPIFPPKNTLLQIPLLEHFFYFLLLFCSSVN